MIFIFINPEIVNFIAFVIRLINTYFSRLSSFITLSIALTELNFVSFSKINSKFLFFIWKIIIFYKSSINLLNENSETIKLNLKKKN